MVTLSSCLQKMRADQQAGWVTGPGKWQQHLSMSLLWLISYPNQKKKKKVQKTPASSYHCSMTVKIKAVDGHHKLCSTSCNNVTHTFCFFCLKNLSVLITFINIVFKLISTYEEKHWYLLKLCFVVLFLLKPSPPCLNQ